MSAGPITSEPEAIAVRLIDEAETRRLAGWRARGVDADIAVTCLLNERIERLATERGRDRRHVVVACMPKSASTFFNAVLVGATGFRPYLLNTTGHDTERNIDATAIPMFLTADTVSQEHMRATVANVRWLGRLGVRPIVLVRNIFDVLVSMRDHADREGIRGPVSHTPTAFVEWPRPEQLWHLVHVATPWLLSLYVSWLDAAAHLDTMIVTYEDVTGATHRTIRRVLDHAGAPVPDDRIAAAMAAVDPHATRLNQGRAGRGATELSREQQDAVRRIAATYRGVYDLSVVGL